MDGMFTIKGILIEIIEIFGELLVIQEILSKAIRTIFYYELDQVDKGCKIENESKVYSLRGWKECLKEEKKLKATETKQKDRKRLFKPRPSLTLVPN